MGRFMAGAMALDGRPIAHLMETLGDETRLRAVALLSHGARCVGHVQAARKG
jgi:DNA-binding transcriptional ArsR family regulator